MQCECGYDCGIDNGCAFCPQCGNRVQYLEFPISVTYDLVELCRDWHAGQWSGMYSVSSTGMIHDANVLNRLSGELYGVQQTADIDPASLETVRKWLRILERYDAAAAPDE